jgi:hypothetical protein
VILGRVVECELAGLDHLHHLGCDHRLGDAGDRELIVDPYVSNAVRLPRRSTPCAVGGHHRGGHPPSPAMSLRIARNSAAVASETGSSLMSANAAIGKDAAGLLGEAGATLGTDGSTDAGVSALPLVVVHPASAATRAKAKTRPW